MGDNGLPPALAAARDLAPPKPLPVHTQVIVGSFNVQATPLDDGGLQLDFTTPDGTRTSYPISTSAVARLKPLFA